MRTLDAFETELVRCRAPLEGICRKFLISRPDLVSDIVQTTLLKALEKRDQFKSGTNMLAWLVVIARNFIVTFFKRKQKGLCEEGGDRDNEAPDTRTIPANQEDRMNALAFQAALDGLPVNHRQTILLTGVYGYSHVELERIWDCPAGTVKSRVNRARKAMAERLDVAIPKGHISFVPIDNPDPPPFIPPPEYLA